MLTVKQLRYFVEIVDCGSFSLAAERLFIAQSALSRQVKDMEALMGVTLLARDTRPLEATSAGRSVYQSARHILDALEDTTAQARRAARGDTGTVRLVHSSSVPLTAAVHAVLHTHLAQHPGVSVEMSQSSSEQQMRDIEQGAADLGLARAPILRRHPKVTMVPLYSEPLVVAVPAAHPLRHHKHLPLAALKDEFFVALPHAERGGLSHGVAELCRAHGFYPRSARVTSRKWSQLALVGSGFGIAVVPLSMGHIAPPGVHIVALEESDCRSEVVALYRPDSTVLVLHFVEALLQAHRNAAPS